MKTKKFSGKKKSRQLGCDCCHIPCGGFDADPVSVDDFHFSASGQRIHEAAAQLLPTQFEYGNYVELFQSSIPFINLFGNSIFVTVIVTLAQLITCSTAAYSFARLNFPGRNVIFGILLCTLMVPIQVTIIPLFIGMSSVNLTDTLFSIILPYLTSIFGIFLMRQFFCHFTQGTGGFRENRRRGTIPHLLLIILPQAGSSLSALGIIAFNNCWNNYFTPLIFINSWEKMTLPLGIAALRGFMGSGNLSAVMAGVTLATLPVIIVFLFAQRFFY